MPSLNVRLTDVQHEVLRAEAFEKRLSIQRVVIGRLFGDGLAAGEGAGHSSPPEDSRAERSVVLPAPAAKPCSRNARHHINHGGNPCPECGWPNAADWKKGKK